MVIGPTTQISNVIPTSAIRLVQIQYVSPHHKKNRRRLGLLNLILLIHHTNPKCLGQSPRYFYGDFLFVDHDSDPTAASLFALPRARMPITSRSNPRTMSSRRWAPNGPIDHNSHCFDRAPLSPWVCWRLKKFLDEKRWNSHVHGTPWEEYVVELIKSNNL